jgi:secreted trypsin-like serine protease
MKTRTPARIVALLVALATVMGLALAPSPAGADEMPTPHRPDGRIVGGGPSANGAWPSQVALINRQAPSTFQGQFCGGTVIDRSWVLTAAHCVKLPGEWTPTAGQIDVLVGTNSLNSGGTRIRAVELRVHPSWNPDRLGNDVALIRLDRPVPASTPIQKLGSNSDVVAGDFAVATGWGALDDASNSYPAALQEVGLEVLAGSTCDDYSSIWSSATQTCAYGFGAGTCFGDSGGPLVVERNGEWVQIGLSSYGLDGCASYPSYFTRVPAFAGWIQGQIRYGAQPNASAFVKRQYLDLFGRQPTSTELFYGVAGLEDGQSTAAYVAGLLENATFKARSGGVIRLYKAIFLRAPDSAGLTFWMGEINRGVSLKRIADLMVRAQEFKTMYGSLGDADFVDLVYDNVLGRPPSDTDRTYWATELSSGRRTRGQVMVGFSESAEYRTATDPDTRVTAAFWALVRRVPTPTEITQWKPRSTGDIARFLLTSYSYAARF